ncbi:MAG: hypothetical protein ACYDAL_00065 [Candidatus Dormibacteraceae bacterium]
MAGVLVCLGAGIFEAGLFIWLLNNNNPRWSLALIVIPAGIVTSGICVVWGVFGVLLKPRGAIPGVAGSSGSCSACSSSHLPAG